MSPSIDFHSCFQQNIRWLAGLKTRDENYIEIWQLPQVGYEDTSIIARSS
jgi:hypothetical protein